jgi:hypothetical protein
MDERIIVPYSAGAAAKKFYVQTSYEVKEFGLTPMYLKPGSYVNGIKVIAQGLEIRDIERLKKTYRLGNGDYTNPKDWCKMRGSGIVTDGTDEFQAEVHWYECPNVGKVEFKVKNIFS